MTQMEQAKHRRAEVTAYLDQLERDSINLRLRHNQKLAELDKVYRGRERQVDQEVEAALRQPVGGLRQEGTTLQQIVGNFVKLRKQEVQAVRNLNPSEIERIQGEIVRLDQMITGGRRGRSEEEIFGTAGESGDLGARFKVLEVAYGDTYLDFAKKYDIESDLLEAQTRLNAEFRKDLDDVHHKLYLASLPFSEEHEGSGLRDEVVALDKQRFIIELKLNFFKYIKAINQNMLDTSTEMLRIIDSRGR